MARVFCVAYSSVRHSDEMPRLHHTRDGNAALELMSGLARHGYVYETALHFYPSLALPAEHFAMLHPDDLLLLPTRPPIETWLTEDPPVGFLLPSGNELEKAVFTAIKPFFQAVSRYEVDLSPLAAAWLKHGYEDHAELEFTRHSHAFISRRHCVGARHVKLVPARRRLTAGYFIKLRAIPGFGCGLVCSFGISGVENLLFARLVRRNFSAWLQPAWQGFGLLRFTVPTAAEDTPLSAANFDAEIVGLPLVEQTFDAPPVAAHPPRAHH